MEKMEPFAEQIKSMVYRLEHKAITELFFA